MPRVARFTLVCAYCAAEFTRAKPQATGMKAYCSAEHQRLGQRYTTGRPYSKSGPYAGVHVCPECSSEFSPHHPSVIYCSKNCKSRAANARTVARWKERAVVGDSYTPQWRKQYKMALLETQHACSICQIHFSQIKLQQIHVDHDHQTGQLRGLLCSSCNQGLGNFKDSIERLEAAIEYLKHWNDEKADK